MAHGLSCSTAFGPWTRDRTRVPCISRRILTPEPPGKPFLTLYNGCLLWFFSKKNKYKYPNVKCPLEADEADTAGRSPVRKDFPLDVSFLDTEASLALEHVV